MAHFIAVRGVAAAISRAPGGPALIEGRLRRRLEDRSIGKCDVGRQVLLFVRREANRQSAVALPGASFTVNDAPIPQNSALTTAGLQLFPPTPPTPPAPPLPVNQRNVVSRWRIRPRTWRATNDGRVIKARAKLGLVARWSRLAVEH
jgi:hypothetical protein